MPGLLALLASLVLLASCRTVAPAAPPGPTEAAATVEEVLIGRRLTIAFRATPEVDVLYLLDCLAGVEKCSRDAYEELAATLGLSTDDRALIAEWGMIRGRYDRGVRIIPGPRVGFPSDLDREINLGRRLRLGGYEAGRVQDFRRVTRLLLLPADADRTAAIVRHFRDRYLPYWRTTARGLVEPAVRRLAAFTRQHELLGLFERIAGFYQAQLPDPPVVTFHLLVRPRSSGATTGKQLENHALIEVIPGQPPEARIDVVAHELFHYFLDRTPISVRTELLRAFIAAPDPASLAVYGLLDESLATAFGNGLVAEAVLPPEQFERRLTRKGSLYDRESIDETAKATLALVRAYLSAGRTLSDPAFVSDYLKATRERLGERLDRPLFRLNRMGLGHADELEHPAKGLGRLAQGRWTSMSLDELPDFLVEYPSVSAALFVTGDQVANPTRWATALPPGGLALLARESKHHTASLYAFRRSPKAWLYVFVGRPGDAISKLTASLGARQHECTEGLCVGVN